MQRHTAAERITLARIALRRALENWDASALAKVEAARALVEEAAADMQEAHKELREGSGSGTADLRGAVADLKCDIARLIRLTDAGAVFYRGLAVRLGDASVTYTAVGQVVTGTYPAGGLQG
jgi:hypothetical protein